MIYLEVLKKFTQVLFTAILGIAFLIYSLSSVLQRFFFVPPLQYKKKIIQAINNGSNKLTKKKLGIKLGSLRRRIILASNNPSLYSTNTENSSVIQLQDCDVAGDDESVNKFVADTQPRHVTDPERKLMYGFFHPYCNAGGGGERVLWQAVHLTLNVNKSNIAVVYTGDDATPQEIIRNVQKRFNLNLDYKRVVFIHLRKRFLVDGSYWKNWTLLGQAIGSVILAIEGIYACPPDFFLDTMGYPFTYPVVYYLLKIPILSYTHFPVIQSDMLNKLNIQISNQRSFLNKAKLLGKYVYWKLFLVVYTFVGYYIDVPLCNGTWTFNHLNDIWWMLDGTERDKNTVKTKILYPPCSTENFINAEKLHQDIVTSQSGNVSLEDNTHNNNRFMCLAQFRPEKRHSLIIFEFARFLKSNPVEALTTKPELVFIGSIRGEQDRAFVKSLQEQTVLLGIEDLVKFILDAPYSIVEEYFGKCGFGINAMWNEHFGIAVVETMASGLIPVSHASAGPFLDIAVPWDLEENAQSPKQTEFNRTGFFFKSPTDPDYQESSKQSFPQLHEIFAQVTKLTDEQRAALRLRGKACVLEKFSNQKFESDWERCLTKLVKYDQYLREQKGKVEQVY